MNRVSQLLEVLRIAIHPDGGVRELVGSGLSVSSFEMAGAVATHAPVIRTVIDAGANRGQFARASARRWPGARVYAFEPLPDMAALLRRRVGGEPRIRVVETALGERTGRVKFFRNAYTHVSSVLPIHEANDQPKYDKSLVTELEVPITRLDEAVATLEIESPVLLKMDVQGYERAVLEGATAFLSRIDYLVYETSFQPLYEGQPVFDALHDYVRGLGFEFVAPVGFNRGKGFSIIEMDVLYRRAGAP